jgi:hypothetical protein
MLSHEGHNVFAGVCTRQARDKNIVPVLRDAESQVQGL